MKANKYKYILLLLCFVFLKMNAQQYDRIRVRYGDHDNPAWTSNNPAANEGLRNPDYSGAFQVPAISGGVNARVQLWGAGGGSGGGQAQSLTAGNAAYTGTGGGGGGGYGEGNIGTYTIVPTVSTTINNRVPSEFTIHVGRGGALGVREVAGSGNDVPYDGGAGGDTWVFYVNNIVAGGGRGTAGGRTRVFINGIWQTQTEIETNGGAGGSGSINGGTGAHGVACNVLCNLFNPYARGGAGGNVANGTNTHNAGTGAGGGQVQVGIPGIAGGVNQVAGNNGQFPGGGAGGMAITAQGTTIITRSGNDRGGAGANGLAYFYVDIFAESAANPEIALVKGGMREPIPANNRINTNDIDYMLVVTNPQPVEYFWYKDDQLLEDAKEPFLIINEQGTYKVRARTYTGTYHFPKAISVLDGQDGLNSPNVTVSGERLNFSVTIDESIGTFSEFTVPITFVQAPVINDLTYYFTSGNPSRTITVDDLKLANADNIVPDETAFTWTILSRDIKISRTTTASNPQELTTGALLNRAFTTRQVIYLVTPHNEDSTGEPFLLIVRVSPGTADMNLPREGRLCINQPLQLGTDRYAFGTWSSSDPNIIKVEGNGIITALRPGAATITFEEDEVSVSELLTAEICDVRVNPHIRATFKYNCEPMMDVVLTPAGTAFKFLDADGIPKSDADAHTIFEAIAFSSNGERADFYEWYVNDVLQGERTTNHIFTFTTPVPEGSMGIYEIKVFVYDECTGTDTSGSGVESIVSIVNVVKDDAANNKDFEISGQVCYDVRMTDNRNGSDMACLPLSARVDDFVRGVDLEFGELVATKRTFIYTFINREGVNFSDLSFSVHDPHNLLAGAPQPGADNTVSITFRKDIHTHAEGQRYTLTLIATYKSDGIDRQVSFPIDVQDCTCGCRVRTVNGGWLTFMCYNLGASDEIKTMTAVEQAEVGRNSNSNIRETVYGDLYQWGRHTDGHEKRGSSTRGGRVNLTPGLTAPASHANLFITQGGTPYAWYNSPNTAAGRSLWDGNEGTGSERRKTINDPCPSGWRLPTIVEWQSILNGGTTDVSITGGDMVTASGNRWVWNGAGIGTGARGGWLVSPNGGESYTLYIPSGGYREGTTAGAPLRQQQTAHYWSSTAINDSSGRSRYLNVQPTQLRPNMQGGRIDGHSVRCVME